MSEGTSHALMRSQAVAARSYRLPSSVFRFGDGCGGVSVQPKKALSLFDTKACHVAGKPN
jgi:hypothetical protein